MRSKQEIQARIDARIDAYLDTPEGAYQVAQARKADAWKGTEDTQAVKVLRGENYPEALQREIAALQEELEEVEARQEDQAQQEEDKHYTPRGWQTDAILQDAFQKKQQRQAEAWGGESNPAGGDAPSLKFMGQ